ncbi:MAG TPA: DedA family protein [archaeon]|nr:DedA family protein [archaeon]
MLDLIGIILHLDTYLAAIISDYGLWVYLILFLIIFLETGLVITPFLPGDSLLFVAGTLAAAGLLNFAWLFVIFVVAAIIGDTVNYWIGHHFSKRVLEKGKIRFVKKEHLQKSNVFYEKHGNETIIIARFLPFIRTFAPFVAGIARMKYKRFISYNVIGGLVWVAAFLTAGFFFGNIPIVKDNLGLVVVGIVVITVIAGLVGFLRQKK